ASIEVEGMDGTLDLSSQGGSIRVVGTPQDLTAETMDGAVEVAGGTARARVKTVSGDILLRGASQDLGASTLSGRIVVRAAGWQRGGTGVQRGKFESVTGDIRFEGELGRVASSRSRARAGRSRCVCRRAPSPISTCSPSVEPSPTTWATRTRSPERPAQGRSCGFRPGREGRRSQPAASRAPYCWNPSDQPPGTDRIPRAPGAARVQ